MHLPSICLAAFLAAGCRQPERSPDPPVDAPRPLPHARHGHRIERVDGGWLCFGGYGAGAERATRETWFLPPGGDAWQRRADLVHEHAFSGSATLDGAVFAIGAAVERYDAAGDRWRVVTPPGALPRSHVGVAAAADGVHVLGGVPATGTGHAIVDPATGAVTAAPAPATFGPGDHLPFVTALHDGLHVLGGMRNEPWGVVRDHWLWTAGAWRRLDDLPVAMWAKFGAGAVHGEELFVFGEFGGFAFDPRRGEWRPLAPLPAMIAMPAVVTTDDAIWIVGGLLVEPEGRNRRVLWRYDVAADRWTDRSP